MSVYEFVSLFDKPVDFSTNFCDLSQGGLKDFALHLDRAQADELEALINNHISSKFNYPECLERITEAGVNAAEAKILEFKRMDELKEMLSIPEYNVIMYGGGGQAGGSISSYGVGASAGHILG